MTKLILFLSRSLGRGWELILPHEHLDTLYASSRLNMIVYLWLHPVQITDLSLRPFISLCIVRQM